MSAPASVLVTGASGQLGRALWDTLPPGIDWLRTSGRLDITDRSAVLQTVRALKPALIINAAAYTAVDRAESDSATAFRVNRDGAACLAEAAAALGARFVQVSTDFVFSGRKRTPYLPLDVPEPLNVYGDSKLQGEQAVQSVLGGAALIVRTAWVHYPGGNNFVQTMLRLMRERAEVPVVADQVGTPTYAGSLAQALWALTALDATGIHHWTDAGVASWYDFAEAIREAAIKARPRDRWARVVPIGTGDYPRPARRPSYSVLEKAATWRLIGVGVHWRENLEAEIGRHLAA